MDNFENIIDPHTKEKVSLFSQHGGNILEQYVHYYKKLLQQKNNKWNSVKNSWQNVKNLWNVNKTNKWNWLNKWQ